MLLNKKAASIFLVAMALQGCVDSNMTDLRTFVDDAFKDQKPEIEPLPEQQPYVGFEYASADKNEPFDFDNIITNRDSGDEGVDLGASVANQPDPNRVKEPLEEKPLDSMSMVGTISQEGEHWVVVKTAEAAHLVSVGNYLGQNNGKITEIFPDEKRIVIVETVTDPAGRWVTRDVEMIIDKQ